MEFAFGDLSVEETAKLVASSSSVSFGAPKRKPKSSNFRSQPNKPSATAEQSHFNKTGSHDSPLSKQGYQSKAQTNSPLLVQQKQISPQKMTQPRQQTHTNTQPTQALSIDKSQASTENTQQVTKLPSLSKRVMQSVTSGKSQRAPPHFAVHGILNEGNTCYMNAPLQVLFSLPHFREIMFDADVGQDTLLYAIKSFLQRFMSTKQNDILDPRQDVDRILRTSKAFSASAVYNSIGRRNPDLCDQQHHQHDAEELLSFLLSTMHDELIKASSINNDPQNSDSVPLQSSGVGSGENTQGQDDWQEVGPKQTTAKIQKVESEQSALSSLMCGVFRSTIQYKSGARSIFLQPFFVLQADITPQTTELEDALAATFSVEVIEGVQRNSTASSIGTAATVTKQIHFEQCPPVLFIQLKRFVYVDGYVSKLCNHVAFSALLQLRDEWLSGPARVDQERQYHLHAVIFHVGATAENGHYTASIRSSCGWLDFNDKKMTRIQPSSIYYAAEKEHPYILVYIRNDARDRLNYR